MESEEDETEERDNIGDFFGEKEMGQILEGDLKSRTFFPFCIFFKVWALLQHLVVVDDDMDDPIEKMNLNKGVQEQAKRDGISRVS